MFSREEADKLPIEAKRRAVIVTVMHTDPIYGPIANPRIQELVGRWVANGALTDSEWIELADAAPKRIDPTGG